MALDLAALEEDEPWGERIVTAERAALPRRLATVDSRYDAIFGSFSLGLGRAAGVDRGEGLWATGYNVHCTGYKHRGFVNCSEGRKHRVGL